MPITIQDGARRAAEKALVELTNGTVEFIAIRKSDKKRVHFGPFLIKEDGAIGESLYLDEGLWTLETHSGGNVLVYNYFNLPSRQEIYVRRIA